MVDKNSSWRKRRSTLERGLMMLAVFSVLLCLALAAPNSKLRDGTNDDNTDVSQFSCTCSCTRKYSEIVPDRIEFNITTERTLGNREKSLTGIIQGIDDNSKKLECKTPSCVRSASLILLKMDEQVNPCDNFYRFVYGRGINENSTATKGYYSDSELRLEMQFERTIIEEPISPNEPKPFTLAKNLYKACMDKSAIEKQGLTPLVNILKQVGGWPVIEGGRWDESEFNWIQTTFKLHRVGYSVNYFLDFSTSVNFWDNPHSVVNLYQATLGLSREHLSKGVDDKVVKAYYSYMVDVAVILGADRVRAEKELNETLVFEMELANILLPEKKPGKYISDENPMTVKELTTAYPSIPWMEFLRQLSPQTIRDNDLDTINVMVPSYISDLEKLMNKTVKRIQANYMMWRAVEASVSYLDDNIRERQFAYLTILNGKTERKPRWEECLDIVIETLTVGARALFIHKSKNADAKKNMTKMVTDIFNQLNKTIQRIEWSDFEEKENVSFVISSRLKRAQEGFREFLNDLPDDLKLEELYKNLELSGENYLQIIHDLIIFGRNGSSVKVTDSSGHVSSTTPDPAKIRTDIAVIMDIFSHDRPRYINYGTFGSIIGRQITMEEYEFEEHQVSSTEGKYLNQAKCIINQYGSHKDLKEELNTTSLFAIGMDIQRAKIVFNGGIKAAFLAYKAWSSRNPPEPRLPGLERFSPRQMFWISAANSWCFYHRLTLHRINNYEDFFSPCEIQILGLLSNMPEFAEDFNCPIGSKMNPKEKCVV